MSTHLTYPLQSLECDDTNTSRAQQRLLSDLIRFKNDIQVYNGLHYFEFAAPLDLVRLETAYAKTVTDFHTLRTYFKESDQTLIRASRLDFTIPHYEFSSVDKLQEFIELETRYVFPLFECTPRTILLRPTYITLGHQSVNTYILFFTIHHICFDNFCKPILFDRFRQYYNSPDTLYPVSTFSYLDFSWFEYQLESYNPYREGLAYWTANLHSIETCELPYDRIETNKKSGSGSLCVSLLTPAQKVTLDKLAQSVRLSFASFVLLTYVWFLSIMLDQSSICLPMVVSNRYRRELQSIVGYFSNICLIPLQIDSSESLYQFLVRCKTLLLNHQTFDYVPLELVLGLLSDQVKMSMLDHMVNFTSSTFEEQASHSPWDNQYCSFRSIRNTCRSHLSLLVFFSKQFCSLQYIYSIDCFDKQTVQHTIDRLTFFLTSLTDLTHPTVQDTSLLLPHEIQMWKQINNNLPSFTTYIPLCQRVYRYQRSLPSKICLVDGTRQTTYNKFWTTVNTVGNHLLTLGKRVPIVQIMNRSSQMIIGMFSIWYSGNSYCPIHPNEPIDRIVQKIKQSSCSIILTQRSIDDELIQSLQKLSYVTLVYIDDLEQSNITNVNHSQGYDIYPTDIAYLASTSGSTGQSKLVAISFESLSHLVQCLESDLYGWNERDTILQVCECSFGPHVREILGALCLGGTLALLPPKGLLNMELILEIIQMTRVSRMYMVPSVFSLLWDYITITSTFNRLCSLKYLMFGGEELQGNLVAKIQSHCPWIQLYNYYGTAELAIHSTIYHISDSISGKVPIGRPRHDLHVKILNSQHQPCLINQKGRLYFEGNYISEGYVNETVLTKERFKKQETITIYDTGDLARLRPDGEIVFEGRLDTQIKKNGQKINMSEIENVLRERLEVKDCLSMWIQDRIVVAIILENTDIIDKTAFLNEANAHCKRYLPSYMVPSAIYILDSFPLNQNGKIDRRAVEQDWIKLQSTLSASSLSISPKNITLSKTSQLITSCFEEIFSNHFTTSFQELMLTQSIQVIRFWNRLNSSLCQTIDIDLLFESTSLDELITKISHTAFE